MNRTYDTILSLTLLHNYYTNGFTPDFVIEPTAATKRWLNNHRWIFRNTAQGFFIGCDNLAMDMLPFILAEETVGLSFVLRLNNDSFMNFTDLPSKLGSKDIYYLYSQPITEEMAIETIALYPQLFTYELTAAGDTTDLQVVDPEGNLRIDETIEGSPGQQLSTSINLENYAPGLYRFMVTDQPDEDIYITNESSGNGIFGLAEITLPADFDPQIDGNYQFQFNARSSVWEYHLLLSKDYNGYNLAIQDTLGTDTFTETEVPLNYDEGSRSVFASQDPILYQETGKRGLRLAINSVEGNRRYDHLPNPAIRNPESKVYLTI